MTHNGTFERLRINFDGLEIRHAPAGVRISYYGDEVAWLSADRNNIRPDLIVTACAKAIALYQARLEQEEKENV